MSEPIISVSGLRGIVGDSLDPIVAIRYTVAYLSTLAGDGPIVVTRDGRSSGSVLADAIGSGICATGRNVLDGNIAATPTTGILVRQLKAAGGIQISASHNPAPYNGIKLFGCDGRVISAIEGQKVLTAYGDQAAEWAAHASLGQVSNISDTTSAHLALVLATVSKDRIASKNFKVVLDSNRGAGSVMGRQLLDALGCQFEILGDVSDGQFEHPPEPTEQNLRPTIDRAIKYRADAVFCQDPDADQLAIIDEQGNYIGEEYTLAITANHALSQHSGAVVVNCSSSRMTADIARKFACPFHLSAVGEANVTDMMIAKNAVYGGEGNGGPIDPRVGYVRDSFVAMAQVLDAMAVTGKSISQLVADIPRYEICKTTIPIAQQNVGGLLDALEKQFPEATASRLDGLRLDWPDRWLLVRPSNTEPIVRAIAEAHSIEAANGLCQTAAVLANSIR